MRAHNSPIGDARVTDRRQGRDELNVGQPCRDAHGGSVTTPAARRCARRLLEARLERFIGVIYRPEIELASHYAGASPPQQFDAWVWFDETGAVVPPGSERARPGAPETWPFGL